MNYLVVKAGQEALELAGVLALPSPGRLLVGPLALEHSLGHAELCTITANSVTALTLLESHMLHLGHSTRHNTGSRWTPEFSS